MVWIIGEYAERIDNADELLEAFLETFPEETAMVGCALGLQHPQHVVRTRPKVPCKRLYVSTHGT